MDPLYKVGDKVLVKSKLDPDCNQADYRFGFMSTMYRKFGGQIVTIKSVHVLNKPDKCKISDDQCLYRLNEDQSFYSWASSMFEPEF